MDGALHSLLERELATCRAAYPEIHVDGRAWIAWVAQRAADAPPGQLRFDGLFLAFACAQGDRAALAEFDRRFRPQVAAALGGRAHQWLIDETMQRLGERLFVGGPDRAPRIHEYRGRSDLGRWVRVVALRLAADAVRESRPREVPAEDDQLESIALPSDAPELALLRGRYGEALRSAVRRAFDSLEPAVRVELRQYYLDGMGVEQLGRLYRVTPSTISRRLAKARAQILDQTRRIMRDELGLAEDDIGSILRVMHTKLTAVARSLRD